MVRKQLDDPSFALQLLGPVTIRAVGDPPTTTRVTQPRLLALLCYLALARPRGLHSRDVLQALLWPEHDDTRARRALRNALHGLRRELGASVVLSAGDRLVGLDDERLACDAHDLERGTWRGGDCDIEPLHGFHVSGAHGFDQWLSGERDRLRLLLARTPDQHVAHASQAMPTSGQAAPRHAAASVHRADAQTLYLRGHYLFLRAAHGGSPEELVRSREYFERAQQADPAFAPALAGLANFFAVAARRELLTPFDDVFGEAISYSARALAIDESLAIPYVHFGVQSWYMLDEIDRAGDAFAQAVANDPAYAEGRRFYGVWLGFVNRLDAALAQMEEAARLEPDIPHVLSSLGAARLAVGDLAGAEEALRRTLQLDPRHGPARERLLRLLEQQERFTDALAERERAGARGDASSFLAAFTADGQAGYRALITEQLRARAQAIEARMVERAPRSVADIFSPPVVQLVSLYAQLGETKKAHAWQLQAVAERPALARWFASIPELRALK